METMVVAGKVEQDKAEMALFRLLQHDPEALSLHARECPHLTRAVLFAPPFFASRAQKMRGIAQGLDRFDLAPYPFVDLTAVSRRSFFGRNVPVFWALEWTKE